MSSSSSNSSNNECCRICGDSNTPLIVVCKNCDTIVHKYCINIYFQEIYPRFACNNCNADLSQYIEFTQNSINCNKLSNDCNNCCRFFFVRGMAKYVWFHIVNMLFAISYGWLKHFPFATDLCAIMIWLVFYKLTCTIILLLSISIWVYFSNNLSQKMNTKCAEYFDPTIYPKLNAKILLLVLFTFLHIILTFTTPYIGNSIYTHNNSINNCTYFIYTDLIGWAIIFGISIMLYSFYGLYHLGLHCRNNYYSVNDFIITEDASVYD